MDKPISVGDLVRVIRGNTCCGAFLGYHFSVTDIHVSEQWSIPRTKCSQCGVIRPKLTSDLGPRALAFGCPGAKGFDLNRLKRVPPLGELESEKREESVNA